MELFKNLGYFFREAIEGFRYGGIMSLAAITTIVLSLTILGGFMLTSKNLELVVERLESRVEISVFLANGMTESIRDDVTDYAKRIKGVTSVRFISKDDALKLMKEDLKGDSELLNFMEENPLPASLELKVENPVFIKSVADTMKQNPWVEGISYGQEFVEKMVAITEIMRKVNWFVLLALTGASLMIIANTIKLTVIARKSEIEIMKLVGATNWFIRWPFLIEGFLQGLFGAVISGIIVLFSYNFIINKVNAIFPFLQLTIDNPMLIRLSLKLLVIGIVVGTIGSLISVRKFLKIE